ANPDCFKADYTITMFAIKTGMLLNDGLDVCGEIHTAYLGAPESIVDEISHIHVLEREDIELFFPERKRRTSKFDYGRVLVIAGSKQYPGAAALTANAAIVAGAGLVQLYSTCFHASILPEVILRQVPETEEGTISEKALDFILTDAEKAKAIVIGPGLGNSKETENFVKLLIEKLPSDLPLLIDADALKAVSGEVKLRNNIVLTPHSGEFSRLTDIGREEIEKSSFQSAKQWAEKLNCTILLKGVPTIITDGVYSYFNINGNPGMASGGSGDVLSGIIGALLAQGFETLEACALGAFLHADAGDRYAGQFAEQTLTASALIDFLQLTFSNKD
ncbi:MAG: NAD(P)H-hydrate dehydratase, partial [Bacteroidota bacterium]